MNEGQKIELSGKTIGMGGERRMGGAIGMPRITRITGRTRKGVSPLRWHYPWCYFLVRTVESTGS